MLPAVALTVKQPWLWFITTAGLPSPKRIENRPRTISTWRRWDPPGEFWLHAGKGDDADYWAQAIEHVRATFGSSYPIPRFSEVPRGGIVGRARIAGRLEPDENGAPRWHADDENPAGGRAFDGIDTRWHFRGSRAYVLEAVTPCRFTPARGLQAFWPVDGPVMAALAEAVRG